MDSIDGREASLIREPHEADKVRDGKPGIADARDARLMTRFGALLVSGVLSLIGLSCSVRRDAERRAQCTPWILQASEAPMSILLDDGHWEFEGNALLVGCREDLSKVTPGERQLVASAIEAFVRDRHLYVLKRADPEFRAAAVASINKAVGRVLVSDVWFAFSFSESGI